VPPEYPSSKVPHSCKPEQQIITQPIEKKEAFVVVRVIFYKKKPNSEYRNKPPTVIVYIY